MSEWKSAAEACLILKLHQPSLTPGGNGMVAEQTLGTDEPATGVMLMLTPAEGSGAWGWITKFPGSQETASTVREVTDMVFPRVHAGNLEARIWTVSS